MASLVAGMVAASMLTFTGSTAASAGQPVTAGAVQTAEAPSARRVLSNEFGTLRSAIRGTFGRNGVVTGTFKPRRFIQEDGKLMARGLLTATLIRGSGRVVGTTERVVTLPVRSVEGTQLRVGAQATECEILNLVLGPLDLNLLGLKVHLDRVVLRITAEPGPGNLLGNLLCAVAGLLDNDGVLTQIRQILNSILAILRL